VIKKSSLVGISDAFSLGYLCTITVTINLKETMKAVAIIYGSSGGNTQSVAKNIASKIEGSVLFDVSSVNIDHIEKFDNLIIGTSTWGMGDLQDDWEDFLPNLRNANLKGKTIALFGLGDSSSFSETFVDGMGTLFDSLKNTGCTIIGSVSADGYSFGASSACHGTTFVGLPIDEDNESNLTESRISEWVRALLPALQ
jgi:flavodoxin I